MPVPTGYAFYNILVELFCIAAVSILLYKQFTVFNADNTQRAFTGILLIQLAYFCSFILRVLVDMAILPKSVFTVYLFNILNFGIFAYCGYRVFVYLELYQNAAYLDSARNRWLVRLPFLLNLALLLSSPLTHVYFSVDAETNVLSGSLWWLMVIINCAYPLASLAAFLLRSRNHRKRGTGSDLKVTVAFPLFFIVFGPVSALQWRLPILPIGLVLADLLVYIQYTDFVARERNQALEAERNLANQQNMAKSTFLSNMSHDIRTPMNAIIGFTNLAIQNTGDTEKVREYLTKIQASSNHLLSLINDVLEMSRIESGKIELDETPCSLPEVLHDLNTIIIGQVEAKQQELFMDAVNVVNEDVYCDRLRLNQVLLNLLSNAIKYTPSGGKIAVRLIQKLEAPEGYGAYELRVKDNGIGMTPEFAARVFEAFEREKSSTVSGIQGTGLGMAITKRIVDLMGGTIEVETAPGEGSEFIVRVNLRVQNKAKADRRIPELAGIYALVVDDDFNTCDSTTRMLSEMGMRSDWTLSGKEAVLRARLAHEQQDSFGVFIIDWKLPDLSGIEVARRIRRVVGDETPILLMTAYDWPSIRDEAVEAGINGFCNKPLFLSELHNALTRVIRGGGEREKPEPEESEQPLSFAGKRLLLVDDIELNREIAVTLLEESDFEVDQACDGSEAVEKIKASAPGYYDAVLMDIQMPVMNGYDAARAIRALDDQKLASVPIIAMTANAFDEDKKAALDAGMNGHVAKPIDVNRLMAELETILRNHR